MSRAATLPIEGNQDAANALISQTVSCTRWTEPVDTTTTPSGISLSEVQSTNGFEIWYLLDSQARSVEASFYEVVRILSRTTIVPINLMSLSSLTPNLLQEEDPWEEDPWVEMPPLSIRDVVMNVEYMGLAKPLDFDLDDILAEE